MTVKSIEITTAVDAIGNIPRQDFESMAETLIAEHFGECSISFRMDIGSSYRVVLVGEGDPRDAEETVEELCGEAFTRCCRGDSVPSV